MQAVPVRLERALGAGGMTGALVRRYDWSHTPLGPMAKWPVPLQTAVSMCLSTSFPVVVNWGGEFIQIYNDAAIPVFGNKHPRALGRPARTNFPEFWEFSRIESITRNIFETGLPFRAEDQRVLVNRKGALEEAYFTFSLSPILDSHGASHGILNIYVETTSRVLGERRMATLRVLAERGLRARTAAEACGEALAALSSNPYDLRFVLLYLADREGASAALAGAAGVAVGSPVAPPTLLAQPSRRGFAWPLEQALHAREAVIVKDLPSKVDLGTWPGRTTPPRDALLLPLARSSDAAPAGVLVAGLSPHLPLDEAYRSFLQLVATGTAAAIGCAEAYEEASARAERLAELAQMRREAAESAAKDTFIATVSHELRTPLSSIKLALHVLAREAAHGASVASARLATSRRAVARMENLVDDLLSVSAIKSGMLTLRRERTDLVALCQAAADEQTLITKREISVELPSWPVFAYVDPHRIQQVVGNLASNALKYSPADRSVVLQLRRTDAEAIITVRDEGPGIPADALPHLFERYYRVPGVEVRAGSSVGLGLGLFVSQAMVSQHGGSIEVETEVGRGTTFVVRLPLAEGVGV
jgi:signal transduction histidine kinase